MAQKSRKVKTPGFVAADVEVDIITCLDRNERIYQARMQTIFKKYNRPFLNNIVVNIEDFTYMTAEGRRLWTFDANDMEDGGSKETSGKVINETEDIGVDQLVLPKKMPSARKSQGLSPRKWKSCDLPEAPISPCSKKKSSTTFDVEPLRGHTTALMEHKTNDRKKISPQNSGLSIMTKNVRIALPLNSTVSEQTKSFMDGNSEEASFSEPGNKTLGDYYPQMIENLCSLLDIEVKNQVADNIIRHYRRLILRKNILKMKMVNRSMSRSFNRTYTICPAPSSEEIATAPKTCVSTQLQEPRLSLSSELYKYDRQAHVDFQNNASILDSQTIYQDNPIQSQQQKDMNGARSLGYSSRTSSPSLCISPSKSITNKSHMDGAIAQSPHRKDSKHLQQNLHSLSLRNLISGIPMLHSPKQMAANPNCNMGEESKSPRKSMTSDSQREVDRYFASYKDPIEPSPERTSTLTSRNSFSFFGHSKNGNFESLYRNLTINGPQPVNSAQIELSKTAYSSLGSSPGSLRAKRLLSHESLVSTSKRPRSVISSSSSSFSMDCSDPFGLEPSSSRAQQHSASASALPPYMSPNSPGSHRSSSPRFNGRSPKRTSACVHRKLIYQED